MSYQMKSFCGNLDGLAKAAEFIKDAIEKGLEEGIELRVYPHGYERDGHAIFVSWGRQTISEEEMAEMLPEERKHYRRTISGSFALKSEYPEPGV